MAIGSNFRAGPRSSEVCLEHAGDPSAISPPMRPRLVCRRRWRRGHLRRIVAAPANGVPGNIEFASILGLRGDLLGAGTPGFPMHNLTPNFAPNRSRIDDPGCCLVNVAD